MLSYARQAAWEKAEPRLRTPKDRGCVNFDARSAFHVLRLVPLGRNTAAVRGRGMLRRTSRTAGWKPGSTGRLAASVLNCLWPFWQNDLQREMTFHRNVLQ